MNAVAAPQRRKRGQVARWSMAERVKLRTAFLEGGGAAALAALPHRSLGSIYNQATEMGLRSPRQKNPHRRYEPDPRLDEAITTLAQRGAERGDWKRLAKRFNTTAAHITSRLRALGFLTTRVVDREWLPAELELLQETTHLAATTASTHFARAGFKRTAWAITIRRRREGLDCTRYGEYTARELGRLLGQSQGAVERLIRQQLLTARKRGTAANSENDHYVITDHHVRSFIRACPLRLDLRKVPPANIPWLIDLLAGPPPK